ncbi:carbonic anhydrase 4-like, partial [Corythoichthys intestinalis]|uniref:carbonic anhydrase 4-like n=2 Tax=Corythoichthys intestinalis TaxID=161448 RepID=UPI0025A61337
ILFSNCTEIEPNRDLKTECNSRLQSPVNIVTRKVLPDQRLAPLHFLRYRHAFHGNLSNNGHTVQLDLPPGMKIKGGNLSTTYTALQLHFHWGKDGGPGSEHTIDGESYPMEMHIVHIKEQYVSLSQALSDPEGVAVLGIFFQESNSANKKFEPLIKALKRIPRPSNKTTVRGISLQMFLPPPTDMRDYFRYLGSLTTPDCAQSVLWTLFENTVPLSRQQLSAFSQLRFPGGRPMVNTFRAVQPLNARQVYRSGSRIASSLSPALVISSVLMLYSV